MIPGPNFVPCPNLGTKVSSHRDPPASLPCVTLRFPSLSQCTQMHVPNWTPMKPTMSYSSSSHLCGESLAPSPPGYPHSPLSMPGEI